MLVHQFLESQAKARPENIAVVNLDRRISYSQLDESANKLANHLISAGIKPGDRVGILIESSIDYVISFFGILKAGGAVVGLNTDTTPRILKSVLSHCAAAGIIVRQNLMIHLKPILSDLRDMKVMVIDGEPEHMDGVGNIDLANFGEIIKDGKVHNPNIARTPADLATIIYTSGTTGLPKGVMLSHNNLRANTESIIEYLHLTTDDKVMDILPLYYSYGLSLLLTHIKVGGCLVIDTRFVFPNVILGIMEKEKVTGFAGVPTTFAMLMHRSNFTHFRWDHLRYLTQAGGPMAPALTARLIEAVPHIKIFVMYGQTEASARLSYLEPERLMDKLGSIGKAIPGVTLTVRDEDGNVCKPGVTGEIVAQGDNIMSGYWNQPAETAAVLKADGLHTGDLARTDEDGFIFIVGRQSEMIKSAAHRISPKEIEEVIVEHEAVAESAVVGRRDDIMGEVIQAIVVLKDGHEATDKDILIHCSRQLPAFKVPKYISFVKTLPKTQSGKVQRNLIKEQINKEIRVFSRNSLKLDCEKTVNELVEQLKSEVFVQLKRQGAIVGTSGGIDSAVVAALCARAFGPERMLGVLLPDKDSSPDSKALAIELADKFGYKYEVNDITRALEGAGCYHYRDGGFRQVFPDWKEGWEAKIVLPTNVLDSDRFNVYRLWVKSPKGEAMEKRLPLKAYLQIVAASNMKQRIRMMTLYYHAEAHNYAVIGTSNKNEYDQGFFVKYGDGGVDTMPIARFYKTQIFQLAAYLGVPESIQKRTPTTDTYPSEVSQEEFFYGLKFEMMDLLWYAKDNNYPVDEVAKVMGLTADQVQRVWHDLDSKKNTTDYLRMPPIGV